jgi:hypothetical protein
LIYELLIFPSDPTYVVAPVQTRSGREDMRKLFAGSTPSLREFYLLGVSFLTWHLKEACFISIVWKPLFLFNQLLLELSWDLQ